MASNNTTDIFNSSCILDFRGDYTYDEQPVSDQYLYSGKYNEFHKHLLLHKYGLVNVVVGAGDTTNNGITNIQTFGSFFDVFICKADHLDYLEYLKENVEYLNANYANQKLICILDVSSKVQVLTFVKIFGGYVSYLDFDDTLWYDFTPQITQRLLCPEHTPSLPFDEFFRIMGAYNAGTISENDKLLYNKYLLSPPRLPAGVIVLGSIHRIGTAAKLKSDKTKFENYEGGTVFSSKVPTVTSKVRELRGKSDLADLYTCTLISTHNGGGRYRRRVKTRKYFKQQRRSNRRHTKNTKRKH